MKIELRSDSVAIEGYVNAVERDSKPLSFGGGIFVEKVQAGAFRRALERAKKYKQEVRVLLNHDYSKELASTRESTTVLYEDNIGLRCRFETRNQEIIDKVKNGQLTGWSFGFVCLKDEQREVEGVTQRKLVDVELKEVSVLDGKIPAYDGTSIELRDAEDYIERRYTPDDVDVIDETAPSDNWEYANKYLAVVNGLN